MFVCNAGWSPHGGCYHFCRAMTTSWLKVRRLAALTIDIARMLATGWTWKVVMQDDERLYPKSDDEDGVWKKGKERKKRDKAARES